jgi:transcriptional regulator with XRE-family HTH domain
MNALRQLRRAHGLSQKEVAAYLGATREHIADIETNRRPARGYEVKTLCHLFAVTPKQLVGHE